MTEEPGFDFARRYESDEALVPELDEPGSETEEIAVETDGDQGLLFDMEEWWQKEWIGMPEFVQEDLTPLKSIYVHFADEQDMAAFAELVDQTITPRTQSIWHPRAEIGTFADKTYTAIAGPASPRYPIYIPSKGRWESRLTAKAFNKIGVPYKIVVEPQERDRYAAVIDPDDIIVLPHRDKGLVATRNWIWDHALESGAERFWTFDDNISGLFRLNHNLKVPVADGTILRVIEDFTDRYENVVIAGMHYFMFASRKTRMPPFKANRRVYSNMLIKTDARDPNGKPYRNEGFYNDDTDLCLRVLKDGWCTILFNAFLIFKSTTMTVKGGMTPHYQDDGRLKMAQELRDKHPDVTTISHKFGHVQHHVNYEPFKRNKLIRKPALIVPEGVNDRGMVLKTIRE